MKVNWFKLAILVIVVSSMVSAFYWYELRPAKIRHDCSWKERSDGSWREARDKEYDFCLHEKGL